MACRVRSTIDHSWTGIPQPLTLLQPLPEIWVSLGKWLDYQPEMHVLAIFKENPDTS